MIVVVCFHASNNAITESLKYFILRGIFAAANVINQVMIQDKKLKTPKYHV